MPAHHRFGLRSGCFGSTLWHKSVPWLGRGLAVAVVTSLLALAAVPAAARPGGPALTDLMKKTPYVMYTGDNTAMEILWQLTATSQSTIQWGPDTTYTMGTQVSTEYGTDHQHSYLITGLTPATKYYFKETTQGVSYRGSFRTAPTADASDLKFVVYGDTRTNTSVHNQVCGDIINNYTADPAFQTLNIIDGDLTADGDNETNWTSELFSPSYPNIRTMMANEPFQCLMGNHEGAGVLFVKYFPFPFAGGRYWSFDYGPAHFVIVDQYTSYGAGSPQLAWIAQDLANSTKTWKFICLHEPGWSAGGGHEDNSLVQTYIQPLCLQYGVSIVFAGHNHYYARAIVSGVTHLTLGGGGAPLYVPVPTYPDIVATDEAYHYSRITISGSSLHFEAVALDGSIIDSFDLEMGSAVGGAPVSHGLALAEPNPFRNQTRIVWWVPQGNSMRMQIADVAGRLVKSFPPGGPGLISQTWDGRDDQGRRLGSGVYYCRSDSRSDPRVLRLMILN